MVRRVCAPLLAVLCVCGPVASDDTGTADTAHTADPATTGEPPVPTTSSDDPSTTAAPTSEPPGDTGDTGDTADTDDAPSPGPDGDEDGFPDAVDLCPSLPDDGASDLDRDGIGDACDLCPREPQHYNDRAGDAQAPVYMQVRNIPHQADLDRDGIGDVCDNCIVRPNCGEFGDGDGQTPAHIGDAVPFDDLSVCQVDVDAAPYLGDGCLDGQTQLPLELPGAAGPVGFLDADDFDQDGLANVEDLCPRFRVEAAACAGPEDCGGAACTHDRCNHVDADNDGVGDPCDTCPSAANPKQVLDGGQQEDDPDGDFVGDVCESDALCSDHIDPRPIGFNTLSAGGVCCVALFDEDVAPLDPGHAVVDGQSCEVVDPAVPLRVICPEDQENITCRQLPAGVVARPGVVGLPPGCDAAGVPLTLGSPGIASHDDLYRFACRLPARDRDLDGVGDACDLCPDAFDPNNGETFCTGDYDPATNQTTCP